MKFLALIVVLFITSCASSVPPLTQYLLRTDTSGQYAVEQADAVIGLGVVAVAPYIDGLGIVLETSPGNTRAARDHQWTEPLRDSLRAFLAREISGQAGQIIRAQNSGESDWQRRVDIRINELHGTVSGEARLVAYWSVFDIAKRSVAAEYGFEDTEALGVDGYEALVQAEKRLLKRFAVAVAATL